MTNCIVKSKPLASKYQHVEFLEFGMSRRLQVQINKKKCTEMQTADFVVGYIHENRLLPGSLRKEKLSVPFSSLRKGFFVNKVPFYCQVATSIWMHWHDCEK